MLLLLWGAVAYGQQNSSQDSLKSEVREDTAETKVKAHRSFHGSIFVEVLLENVPSLGSRNFNQQFGLGIDYYKVTAGIYQNIALGRTTRTLIFPNEFELIYGYMGGYLGVHVVQQELWSGTLRVNYGHGDMIWERTDTKEDFVRDTFHVIKPEIVFDLTPTSYFHAFITVGYRQFPDLELATINQSDFSGVTVAMGIKLGYFK